VINKVYCAVQFNNEICFLVLNLTAWPALLKNLVNGPDFLVGSCDQTGLLLKVDIIKYKVIRQLSA